MLQETPKELTLLLVRHGETAWNREGRLQGWRDVPLSPAGYEQARRLAFRLAALWHPDRSASAFIPGPPCAFYASDLNRVAETARLVAEAVAPLTAGNKPVQSLCELRERHFGEREGLTAEEARAKWGDAANYPETGETYAQVNERMETALQMLWDNYAALKTDTQTPASVLVAGHGGSLRLWLCRAAHLGPESVGRFHLDNTSLSLVTFTGASLTGSEGRILLCNDTAHLHTD